MTLSNKNKKENIWPRTYLVVWIVVFDILNLLHATSQGTNRVQRRAGTIWVQPSLGTIPVQNSIDTILAQLQGGTICVQRKLSGYTLTVPVVGLGGCQKRLVYNLVAEETLVMEFKDIDICLIDRNFSNPPMQFERNLCMMMHPWKCISFFQTYDS